ncbi:uncharacterized protein LOC142339939 [Convolutriloba macropyga]|uniref:uncharacterized protein LOC142339939 n=1 Tax=Convolutriloba macropyga TaxID=536237 RepID=UPI003F523778
MKGYSSCPACHAGYYADKPGSQSCQLCAHGYYTGNETGTVSCKQCPKGNYCPYPGFDPFPCPPKSVCPAGSVAAIRCTNVVQSANINTQECNYTAWFYIFTIVLSFCGIVLIGWLSFVFVNKIKNSQRVKQFFTARRDRLSARELDPLDIRTVIIDPSSDRPVYGGL